MQEKKSAEIVDAAKMIDGQIAALEDWRGELLAQLRTLVLEADPEITEEWKWDTAVWARQGLVCSAGVFKDHVKLNFFKGAAFKDPLGLFNAGLDAKATRAIDFKEGDRIDEAGLKDLVHTAAAYNLSNTKKS